MKWEFHIHELDDMPPYQWELSWTDANGERWSEEYRFFDEVIDRIEHISQQM